jgi:hypothetical protein
MSRASYGALEYAAVLAYAAILVCQLFVSPPLGLANNGDFGKAVGFFSVGSPFDHEYKYADLKHPYDPQLYRSKPPFRSSETLLAALAIGLSRPFSKQRIFDMRWIGAVHGLLSMLALGLLLPLYRNLPAWQRAVWYAALLFMFGDILYVSYFSSFYMDAATYVFLLLTLVLFVRVAKWRRRAEAACLVLCAVLAVVSKTQHAVLGIWLAALVAIAGSTLWGKGGRVFAAISATAIAAALFYTFAIAPPEYDVDSRYTAIFYQILPNSLDVSADLRALGLDESAKRYIGTYAYQDNAGIRDPEFVRAFLLHTSYARVGWFYMKHPRSAYLALRNAASEGARLRPGLGNYDPSAGKPPYAENHGFSLWSDAKQRLFFRHPERYLAFYFSVALLVCAAAAWRRGTLPRAMVLGCLALVAMAATALLLASLADAAEIARHFFIANMLLDAMLVAAMALLFARPKIG